MRDTGSFRDPSGFVILDNNKVIRVVNYSYKDHFDHLIKSGLYDFLVKNKWLVSHEEFSGTTFSENQYLTLNAKKIFPITYPYEWSYSQLKDAALLTLKIQEKAIEYDMTLKDSSPYNIQFYKNSPIFIDTLSFEKIKDNFSWKPYKQFCEMFLGPLCLMKYKDPSLLKLLITFIDGVPLELINKLLSLKDKLRPSVLIHLVIHNWISSKSSQSKFDNTKNKKISKSQHLNIIQQLKYFISNLEVTKPRSEWGDYNNETISEKKNYVIDKERTINTFLHDKNFNLVWDMGSNDGFYSRLIASKFSKNVFSLDFDWYAVEKNYVINKKKKITNVFPILFDLSNPSPSIGWANKERSNSLALIHHVLNSNIPLEFFIDLLSKSKSLVLIEYVPFSDPKCQKIFKSRDENFKYPSKEEFKKIVCKKFEIINAKKLEETERILFLLKNIK